MIGKLDIWTRVVSCRDVTKRYMWDRSRSWWKVGLTSEFIQGHCSPNCQSLVIKAIYFPVLVYEGHPSQKIFVACCMLENTGQMAYFKMAHF
jgi:hypothetical protein